MTNAATKMSESVASSSEKPPVRLKAWADSLHELRRCIAEAECLFPHPSASQSPPCVCASLEP